MKRVRDEEDDQSDDEHPALDWLRLFHDRCILMVLAPYLSLADIVHLSCVNKKMYYEWVHHEERVDVLQLRQRIRDLTGRNYTKKLPLQILRREALKARAPIWTTAGTKFVCFWCQRSCTTMKLGNRDYFPYATCERCIFSEHKFRDVWTYCPADWIEEQVNKRISLGSLYRWPQEMRDVAQAFFFGNGKSLLEWNKKGDRFIHSSHFKSDLRKIVEKVIQIAVGID